MAIRSTSMDVYNEIKENGLLSKMRFAVYSAVYEYGPITSAEAFQKIIGDKPMKALTQSRARFTELRDMGVLQELGTRKCKVTGHNAIVWDITGKLPKKIGIKGKTKEQKKAEILDLLDENAELFNAIFILRLKELINLL